MEYYLVIKRNEVLICATTWKTLENIILSERKKSNTKCTYYIILFT